ncbi:hypothetical protein [Anaerocolumna aminovalerica]|uniref:hypothetical protein n=1 Tax=Anaerocolumna aminovalerica TaxID=1527 RepID=UPI00148130E7|nr:hypothetical protein [Anaerocolumna aminovalerica]
MLNTKTLFATLVLSLFKTEKVPAVGQISTGVCARYRPLVENRKCLFSRFIPFEMP